MAISKTSDLSNTFTTALTNKFLKPLEAEALFYQFAIKGKIGVQRGHLTVAWPTVDSLAADASTLTEGTPPSIVTIADSQLTATLEQLGGIVGQTDVAETQGLRQTTAEILDRLKSRAKRSLDLYYQRKAKLTTTVLIAGTTTGTTVNTDAIWDTNTLRRLHSKFVDNNVIDVPPGAVAPFFPVFLRTTDQADLMADANQTLSAFLPFLAESQGKSPTGGSIWKNTPGALHGIAPKATNMIESGTTGAGTIGAATYASTIDAYNAIALGMNGLGTVDFIDAQPKNEPVIMVSARVPIKGDELAQQRSYGYKITTAARVLLNAAVIGVPSYKA